MIFGSAKFRFPVVFMLAFACATAARAQSGGSLPGLSTPRSVAGFTYSGLKDYESRQAGLGYSARYENTPAWADVYSYTRGYSTIPANYSARISKAELKVSEGEIGSAVRMGAYASARKAGSLTVGTNAGRFNCTRYRLVSSNGNVLASILCLTNQAGRFIKLRISGPDDMLADKKIRPFISYWLSAAN